ncbi:MAG TPA: sigma-70 family RNA polymerase sigma factor [Bryobacteraceae bacterium]|nr:sigma-70 family RNA polymerase sigma factor [Bryobacteraceae bacterium]
MAFSRSADVTGLLLAWSNGDERALHRLIPVIYEDLRQVAHSYMSRERSEHTLQTTALVHEAYNRLVENPRVRWQDRAHFLAVCARLMRRVLVDYARSRACRKRGGGMTPVSIDGLNIPCERTRDLVAIDDALTALAELDRRKSQVVELRFFGGLTVEETAEFLKVSPDTVMRDWKTARAWMRRHLSMAPREHAAAGGETHGA